MSGRTTVTVRSMASARSMLLVTVMFIETDSWRSTCSIVRKSWRRTVTRFTRSSSVSRAEASALASRTATSFVFTCSPSVVLRTTPWCARWTRSYSDDSEMLSWRMTSLFAYRLRIAASTWSRSDW